MIHLPLPWETRTHSTVINNGRRIPTDHEGESRPSVCMFVRVHLQARVHMCYYPLSSWTSITTSP